MAGIPLTGSEGLFTRIGVLAGLASAVNVDRGTVVPGHVGEIQQQFINTDQDVIDSLYSYMLSYQNSCSGIMSNVKTMASNAVVEMANDSVPQPNSQLSTAMQLLIAQMKAANQTVNACTVGGTITPYPTNSGNAVGVVSHKDVNGKDTEYMFAELATATVVNDYQGSSSLLGVEPITLTSPAAVQDTLSWLYPAGSGATKALAAISALTNGSSGTSNWLNNGAMESFTASANIPDYWHIGTGVAGSTVYQSTAVFYDGVSSVRFLGNGSENTSIYQRFSVPSASYDTFASIYPNSQFAVNLALSVSSTPASGVLRVSLSNASGVLVDNSGISNSFSVNLNTLTSSWSTFQGVFRTPNKLPTAPVYLDLALTTPLASGVSLYIDHVAFSQMSPLYPGGPSVSIFSGNVPLIRGDSFAVNLTNDYAGKMQYMFDRIFGMKSMGLILPSSGSPTIPDSLIQ